MAAAHQRRNSALASSAPHPVPPMARSGGPRQLARDEAPLASPARNLQNAIEAELASSCEAETPRWPGAVRLSFIGGSSLLLWIAIIAGVRALL